jgi:hypothetical protein
MEYKNEFYMSTPHNFFLQKTNTNDFPGIKFLKYLIHFYENQFNLVRNT